MRSLIIEAEKGVMLLRVRIAPFVENKSEAGSWLKARAVA